MKTWTKILVVMVLVVPFVISCAGPSSSTRSGEKALKQSAKVVVIPCSGKPESKIAIMGSGFTPGEEVQIEVNMSGGSLLLGSKEEAHVANETGAIKIDSFIPGSLVAKNGVYTVKAIGNKGSLATYPLEVVVPPPAKK